MILGSLVLQGSLGVVAMLSRLLVVLGGQGGSLVGVMLRLVWSGSFGVF